MHTRLFAVMATVGLVLFALGPGAATVAADSAGNDSLDVSVSQQVDAEPNVSVTDNGTAVENATVTVDALDNGTYAGTGENYSTDANGTVSLPAPEENVSVEVTATADNATASTTADLTVSADNETDSFGTSVSAFVQSLLSGNSTDIGQQVAEFVTDNNPGNAPEWAGPPQDGDRGPPAHAGGADNDTDDKRGPPAHAGGADNDTEENETDGNETDENETDDNETEDDSDDDDDRGGPPEQARGNGN